MSRLVGRTALVTGGSGGIGSAVARGLGDAGPRSLSQGPLLEPGPSRPSLDASGSGPSCQARTDAESSSKNARTSSVPSTSSWLPTASATRLRSTAESLNAWSHTLEVNLTATFDLCQRFGAGILRRGSGRIILVASMYAFFGGVRVAAYTASKGGIAQLTKALSNEWAAHGVKVNALAPGYVRTSLNEHVWVTRPGVPRSSTAPRRDGGVNRTTWWAQPSSWLRVRPSLCMAWRFLWMADLPRDDGGRPGRRDGGSSGCTALSE